MFQDDLKKIELGRDAWDKDERGVTGLYARLLADKRVNLYLYYRTKTKVKRNIKLGTLGEITLGQARELARSLLLEVASGGDPKADRDKARGEKTVAELFEIVHKDYWTPKGTRWAVKDTRKLFDRYAKPKLGKRRLSEVDFQVISDWHGGLRSVPYAANRTLSVLTKMFKVALQKRLVTVNPCQGIEQHLEQERVTMLDPEADLPRVFALLEEKRKAQPREATFCFAALKSGARLKDLEELSWPKIRLFRHGDEELGVYEFEGKSTAKTGQLEQVVFDAEVLEWFRSVPARDDGRVLGIETPHEFWRGIRDAIGRPDVWLRDSRRTFAVVALDAGLSDSQMGQSLNHASTQTTRRYARLRDRARYDALARVAGKMGALRKK